MELRHLRYFVAVAEEGSFLRAASRLRVAQPALSKQIRDLEREVGVTLFHRLPRGIRLTPAGEAFLVEARGTLTAAGRAVTSARGAANDDASDLEFAHGELGLYTSVIEDLLAAFRCAYPKAQVRVSSMSDADTDLALREGKPGRWRARRSPPRTGRPRPRSSIVPLTSPRSPAGSRSSGARTRRASSSTSSTWRERWAARCRTLGGRGSPDSLGGLTVGASSRI